MSKDSSARDQLNADVVALMRQQTGPEGKEIEVMGKRFLVLPEV